MAAGRTTPFVGLNFNWAVLRDCDMITVGGGQRRPKLARISRFRLPLSSAALPTLAARSSPFKQSILGHK